MKGAIFVSERGPFEKYKLYAGVIIVFILALSVRLVYMTLLDQIKLYPDSIEYLRAADKLDVLRIDIGRVPVYPLFIKLAGCIFPWYGRELAVVIFQMLISSICASLIFYISLCFFKSHFKAFTVALFTLSNVWIVNWDFLLLTESLTILLIVLLVIFFSKYLDNNKNIHIAASYLICALLIFLKPFYLLFPIGIYILTVIRAFKEGILKQTFITGVLSLALIYTLVASYSWMNFEQNGYYGISDVSAVNKMGKVLQYRMYELGEDEDIKSYIRQETELKNGEILDPIELIYKYGLEKDAFREINEFAGKIIKSYPHIFINNTVKLIFGENGLYKENAFTDYNSKNYIRRLPAIFIDYSAIIPVFDTFGYILCLMLLEFLYLIYMVLIRKEYVWNWILVYFLTAYQVVMSIMGSHAEYPRLIAPVYILIFLITFKYLFQIFKFIKVYFERLRK